MNNDKLYQRILGYLAKYQEKYNVIIYAFVFMGNHFHLTAQFPDKNRAKFYRDFNARCAEAVRALVPEFPGGKLFYRRYAEQALILNEDIENQFFYCALQHVSAGLVERISEYPGYNSFSDATSGKERKYKVIDWTNYNARRRYSSKVKLKDFTKEYKLVFARVPGNDELSQKEYKKKMLFELEKRRAVIVNERRRKGLGFVGRERLLKVVPGASPRTTKTSTRTSFRPLVLTKCKEAKNAFLSWYFSIREQYLAASCRYIAGESDCIFPPDTYKPPCFLVHS